MFYVTLQNEVKECCGSAVSGGGGVGVLGGQVGWMLTTTHEQRGAQAPPQWQVSTSRSVPHATNRRHKVIRDQHKCGGGVCVCGNKSCLIRDNNWGNFIIQKVNDNKLCRNEVQVMSVTVVLRLTAQAKGLY